VLAVPAACPAAPPVLKGADMLECSGLPCIDVTAGAGGHVRMLIDTGNARSILDRAVARRLELKLQPFVGRDGKVHPELATATLPGVRIGGGALGDLPVLVMDLAADVKKGEMPDAEGTLAYTAFGERLLSMDYKRHRVEFSGVLTPKDNGNGPLNSGKITLPTFGPHGPPIVVTTAFSVNGRPISVQIDTLYAGTLLIYPESVDRLGLSVQQQAKALRTFPFTDGGVQMIEGHAERMGFGERGLTEAVPIYFATPGVHTPDGMFDGTVGQELFTGHVLTFDFHSHHFWIS
jgi:hypothetical protein